MINQSNNNTEMYVLSYFTLRISVGILGIILPFILVLGVFFIEGEKEILYSISTYSHTRMGNGFVGILCAVALFLFAYKGHGIIDNITGHLGGISALGVAFFPNSLANPESPINILHLFSVFLFFTVLIFFSIYLFTKSDNPKPYPKPKRKRNVVYYTCGFIMMACIILIAVYKNYLQDGFPRLDKLKPAFWLETFALIAFGISWITKGQALFRDEHID